MGGFFKGRGDHPWKNMIGVGVDEGHKSKSLRLDQPRDRPGS